MIELLVKHGDTLIPILIGLGVTIPILILLGIAWALHKWGPGLVESYKARSTALVNAVEKTIPEALRDFREGLSSAENRITTHVSKEVGTLREEIHDLRIDKIDAKIDRMAGRSSPDLSEHAPTSRKVQ
ncbi:hypothetical protein [Polyangium spumosum]|uniref:Uncharacterized protein n=1 Tax=Polyangium spumosum TaxID=889282 RepID=A0A6N7Q1K2_9BACT|nr:hypothetical protein [Polyangium spumosum]MRG98198.1 hypothetical protein [Polyangium spumosum]